jgi:hypothetical protein
MYGSTCLGRPHAHHQELNKCSSSLWFYLWRVVVAVFLVVVERVKPGPTTTTIAGYTLLCPCASQPNFLSHSPRFWVFHKWCILCARHSVLHNREFYICLKEEMLQQTNKNIWATENYLKICSNEAQYAIPPWLVHGIRRGGNTNCEYGWNANLHLIVEAFRSITVHLSTILV